MKCASNLVNILSDSNNKQYLYDQNADEATYFKRPAEDDLKIDWKQMRAQEICNLINACNPNYQGAVTYFRNVPVRILEAAIVEKEVNGKPGTVITDNENLYIVKSIL